MSSERIAEIVLEAAALLVADEGAQAISLEAIAARTDIAEAEIRAVFPDTEALVRAAAARIYTSFIAKVEAGVGDDEDPGAFTRAYARAYTDGERDDFARLGAALLGSGPYRPDLVAFVRAEQAALRAALDNDGIDPVTATVVRLAADGLWLNALFDLDPVTPERRAAVIDRLVEMTREAPRPDPRPDGTADGARPPLAP